MIEDPDIIQMNIERYRAMLTGALDDEQRVRVDGLLTEAVRQLSLAKSPDSPRPSASETEE